MDVAAALTPHYFCQVLPPNTVHAVEADRLPGATVFRDRLLGQPFAADAVGPSAPQVLEDSTFPRVASWLAG